MCQMSHVEHFHIEFGQILHHSTSIIYLLSLWNMPLCNPHSNIYTYRWGFHVEFSMMSQSDFRQTMPSDNENIIKVRQSEQCWSQIFFCYFSCLCLSELRNFDCDLLEIKLFILRSQKGVPSFQTIYFRTQDYLNTTKLMNLKNLVALMVQLYDWESHHKEEHQSDTIPNMHVALWAATDGQSDILRWFLYKFCEINF